MSARVVGSIFVLFCALPALALAAADFSEDRERLLKAIDLFNEASELTQPPKGHSTFRPPPETDKRIQDLIEEGLSEGRSVSDQYLDSLHPEMKGYFRERLLAGNALYLRGLRNNSVVDQIAGLGLIRKFYDEFWGRNAEAIADKVFATPAAPLSFWSFLLRLLIGSILAPILFSFMLVALLGPFALFARGDDARVWILTYPALGIGFAAQIYFWSMWAAYCANIAAARASAPQVEQAWIYYTIAFLFVPAPLAWLASKEQGSAKAAAELRGILGGTLLYTAVAVVAFIAFATSPWLMEVPFGWFLAFVVPRDAA